MTKKRELYYCSLCGNVLEVVDDGATPLICCGKEMVLLVEKTEDVGREKHKPVLTSTDNTVTVRVGAVEHPMTEEHHIVFIELMLHTAVYRAELLPGEQPMATFPVAEKDVTGVRIYCNVHGAWKI
jgi:superoxide reductase